MRMFFASMNGKASKRHALTAIPMSLRYYVVEETVGGPLNVAIVVDRLHLILLG